MPIKDLIAKIKNLPSLLKKKPLEPEAVPGQMPKPVINKKIIILLVVIALLLAIILTLSQRKGEEEKPAPGASPSPTTTEEEISRPSNYATDSAVLKFEEDLSNLEQDLLEIDLSEAGLNPPLLDWQVEFE